MKNNFPQWFQESVDSDQIDGSPPNFSSHLTEGNNDQFPSNSMTDSIYDNHMEESGTFVYHLSHIE